MIDLHTHSSASDGSLSPRELVAAACEAGLSALALTDHDTIAGVAEAALFASGTPLAFVPGVEISAELQAGALHVVGLFVDTENTELLEALAWAVHKRGERNVRIVEKLTAIGMSISLEDVEKEAAGGVIGRPHFARIMRRRGFVKKESDAFSRYLGSGKTAHVPKEKLSPERAIAVIRRSGGVPVLAHPDQTKRKGARLRRLVENLKSLGLEGIEAYCTGYTEGDTASFLALAKRCDLVVSGGSDFHGAIKPAIALGKGLGGLRVPDALLGPIEERARKIRSAR